MTKHKNQKRALIGSMLSMLLCATMLIGSTLAWFTDNASTNVNTINSGTLDIRLLDGNSASAGSLEGQKLTFTKASGAPGGEAVLFEPGAGYFLQQAWLHNAGNLHAKYKVVLSGIDGSAALAQVLEVHVAGVNAGTLATLVAGGGVVKEGTIAPGEYDTFGTIELKMPSSVSGSQYMGQTLSGIAITVMATQAAAEYDSHGNTYDSAAGYDEVVAVSTLELQNILNDFADAGSGGNTIQLTNNYTLKDGEQWTPVYVDGYHGADVITVEGNGMTISGLNAPLFKGGFAGGSGIVIRNLTIADSAIVSTNDLGSGAFIETVDSMDIITLENCHVKNSSISGSRTGGLIGWNSGYNNINDGSVKTYVTIKNCTVTGCQITGEGTVGGIVGHAGANAWTWNTIENCTVSNCTLTSNDDSYRVGAIVGTANVGEVVITGCTSTGNTFKQDNKGTEISRPSGQSELYGRFVPNTTGKLTIDGTAIQ